MSELMKKYLGPNWKTNLAAIISFLMGVPPFVTAATNWWHHQPADWRGAIGALVVAAGLAVAKDGDNHSTADQVQKATEVAKVEASK